MNEVQKYYCSICGKEVVLYDGLVERNCEHEGQPVVAEMVAVAYGESHVMK